MDRRDKRLPSNHPRASRAPPPIPKSASFQRGPGATMYGPNAPPYLHLLLGPGARPAPGMEDAELQPGMRDVLRDLDRGLIRRAFQAWGRGAAAPMGMGDMMLSS